MRDRAPLGALLVEQGLITPAELDAALAFKESRGVKLGQALVALHLVTESDLANTLKIQGTIACIHLTPEIVDPSVACLLGAERSKNLVAIAINEIAGIITVAMEDPSDPYVLDAITVQLNRPVFPVYAEPSTIEACLDQVFAARVAGGEKPAQVAPSAGAAPAEKRPRLEPSLFAVDLAREEEGDPEDRALASEVAELELPVVQMVRTMLEAACASRASGIHLEPHSDGLQVRYRVDGYLREHACLPTEWAEAVLTRLKTLVDLDTAETRLPQEGSTQIELAGSRIEVKISTVPTIWGEGAVIRLTDPARALLSVGELGFRPSEWERVQHILEAKDGLVLTAGPANQGKVTTLYALLQHVARADSKVVTIEERIENRLPGVTQVQTDPRVGLTLERAITAILSQDPDVLLIGQIREDPTAELAVQAALGGKLVFSTLDSAGAVEAIARLADMGSSRFAIADCLRGVIAQRLLRRICPACREESEVGEETRIRLALPSDAGPFFRGAGCSQCSGSGFVGRVPLFEILDVDSALRSLVRKNAGIEALHTGARKSGLATLRALGIQRAEAGDTTLDEVYAATARG